MRKPKNYYVVVTNNGRAVCETLSTSKKKSLSRYKEKWLGKAVDPDREWIRRRRRGYRVTPASDFFMSL